MDTIEIGNIIFFGNYDGKEIEHSYTENYEIPKLKFTVLSLNENIYWEPQNN